MSNPISTPLILIANTGDNVQRKSLSKDQHNSVISTLLSLEIECKLPHVSLSKVAKQYDADRNTISTIWKSHLKGESIDNRRCNYKKKKLNETIEKVKIDLPKLIPTKGLVSEISALI